MWNRRKYFWRLKWVVGFHFSHGLFQVKLGAAGVKVLLNHHYYLRPFLGWDMARIPERELISYYGVKLFWIACVLLCLTCMYKLADAVHWAFYDEKVPDRAYLMAVVWVVCMVKLIRVYVWMCGKAWGGEKDE